VITNLLGRRAYIDNHTDRRGERGEIVTVSHSVGAHLSIGILYDDGNIEEYVASNNPNFHICPPQTEPQLVPDVAPSLAVQLDRHQISVEHARGFYKSRYPDNAPTDEAVALVLSHHDPGAIPTNP
jgi:acyl-CoA synthetase (AMP-forming)/AMP-acid ligase II